MSEGSRIIQLVCVLAAQSGVPPGLPGLVWGGLDTAVEEVGLSTDATSLGHVHPQGCTRACMRSLGIAGGFGGSGAQPARWWRWGDHADRLADHA